MGVPATVVTVGVELTLNVRGEDVPGAELESPE
jgi:hypothetical protein